MWTPSASKKIIPDCNSTAQNNCTIHKCMCPPQNTLFHKTVSISYGFVIRFTQTHRDTLSVSSLLIQLWD